MFVNFLLDRRVSLDLDGVAGITRSAAFEASQLNQEMIGARSTWKLRNGNAHDMKQGKATAFMPQIERSCVVMKDTARQRMHAAIITNGSKQLEAFACTQLTVTL